MKGKAKGHGSDAITITANVEGTSGNDILTGTAGADIFIMRAGGGVDVIEGFKVLDANNFNVDRVMFDIYGGYSDVMFLGRAYDGLEHVTPQGGTFTFSAVDYDGDGITDTQIMADTGDGLILLGVAPDSFTGATIMGG